MTAKIILIALDSEEGLVDAHTSIAHEIHNSRA